jgi:type IV secretory pathway protease TraF
MDSCSDVQCKYQGTYIPCSTLMDSAMPAATGGLPKVAKALYPRSVSRVTVTIDIGAAPPSALRIDAKGNHRHMPSWEGPRRFTDTNTVSL